MTAELNFDPLELRKRYLAERDKRRRAEGSGQYLDVSGRFAGYDEDPYADPTYTREPLRDEVDVIVLGGGISGLIAGARLREAGVERIRVVERGGDFGGVWYWNRYPGIRCDVESYIYMPLLEELGVIPTEKYAKGAEILAHCQAIGRHYGLYSDAVFQTQVGGVHWDEDTDRWTVRTDRGDVMRARFVVLGSGPLNRPKLPGIPGIEDFQGHSFHSSRWDYNYTGGTAEGNLTGLQGKRVGIIGTGASCIQIAPNIAPWAEHLYVVQRTPSSVDARENRPTDPRWAQTLRPGWQKRRIANFDAIMLGMPQDEDLVADRWTDVWSRLAVWATTKAATVDTDPAALRQMADFQKMEEIRQRVADTVTDPVTAEALKPYYNQFCKRPLYSDEFLPTFNRDNVTLVDTDGQGVDRLTANGIHVGGREYQLDCLIYATGFNVGAPTYISGGFELTGRAGLPLAKKWAEGVRSLHGLYTAGFPNLFILGGIFQASVTINFTHILGEQATYMAQVVKRCLTEDIATFEIKPEAEDRWAATMSAKSVDRGQFERECTPGFYNNEGIDGGPTLFGGTYGGGPFEYIEVCHNWLADRFEADVNLTYR
jgi:cyclohexanone monooxygenase